MQGFALQASIAAMLEGATTVARARAAAEALAPGRYITDERRLFRVVSQFSPERGAVFAALEDCHSLEVEPYGSDELSRMRLRPVRPEA